MSNLPHTDCLAEEVSQQAGSTFLAGGSINKWEFSREKFGGRPENLIIMLRTFIAAIPFLGICPKETVRQIQRDACSSLVYIRRKLKSTLMSSN